MSPHIRHSLVKEHEMRHDTKRRLDYPCRDSLWIMSRFHLLGGKNIAVDGPEGQDSVSRQSQLPLTGGCLNEKVEDTFKFGSVNIRSQISTGMIPVEAGRDVDPGARLYQVLLPTVSNRKYNW